MFERLLVHLVVLPGVGIGAGAVLGLSLVEFVVLDLALSAGYEAIRLKAITALAVGGKTLLPSLAGLVLVPAIPVPSMAAVVFAATLIAADLIGIPAWVVRRVRRPGLAAGRHWRRPLLAQMALLAAVGVGVFAAGAALLVPPIGGFHIGLAVAAGPLWWAAYRLHNPPRPPVRVRPVLTGGAR